MRNDIQQYKPAKTISEQIQYLTQNKRVHFNEIDKKTAGNKLLQYNYINIITLFKHKFAKLNQKNEVEKVNGKHIYEKDVEFAEYYSFLIAKERIIQ